MMDFVERTPDHGYIGLSFGEDTSKPQAIIYSGDDEFYFYPVSSDTAWNLEDWHSSAGSIFELRDILPDASDTDIHMFCFGHTDFIGEFE